MKQLLSQKFLYIGASVLVSAIGFGRNLFFLKALGLGDIGQVALMQSIAIMVGFSQFGLINGGYRIYAVGNTDQNVGINNTLFTFFAALTVLLLLLAAGGGLDIGGQAVHRETLLIGLAAGIATLGSTWINNMLIAQGKLSESNLINLAAVSLSFLIGAMSKSFGLWAALVSMLIQPLGVVVVTLALRPEIRPTRFQFEWLLLKRILKLGLIPFIAGIFALLNLQVERWAITVVLGTEALGRYYIVLLYATAFALIPVSLNSVYFPRTIKAFEERRIGDFVALFKRYLIDLISYLICIIVVTIILLPSLLNHYFDKYAGSESLIYLAIPGLVALILCNPASLVFNSAKNLRPLLIYGALSLGLNSAALYFLYIFNMFSLEMVAVAKSFSDILSFIYFFSMLMMFRNNHLRQVR